MSSAGDLNVHATSLRVGDFHPSESKKIKKKHLWPGYVLACSYTLAGTYNGAGAT